MGETEAESWASCHPLSNPLTFTGVLSQELSKSWGGQQAGLLSILPPVLEIWLQAGAEWNEAKTGEM